jgi:PilZ domain
LFFLLLAGGALFLIPTVVLGQNPISSVQARRKKLLPKDDWPSPASLANGSMGRGKEKRRSLRRGGIAVPVVVSKSPAAEETIPGLVLNRSRGGLRLSVPEKVEVGQVLAVRTANFPEGLDPVEVRVRHCKQTSDGWHLGCQFVDELPWNVLLLFG